MNRIESLALPTSKVMRLKLAFTSSVTSALGGGAIVAYLSPVMHFTHEQLLHILIGVFVYMIPLALVSAWLGERWLANAFRSLDNIAGGANSGARADPKLAFAEVIDYPRKIYFYNLTCFTVGGIILPISMMLRFELFGWLQSLLMFTGVVIASFLSQAFIFIALKMVLEPLRNLFAMEVPEPDEREHLVRTVSMPRQLFIALVSISVCMAGYSTFLMYGRNIAALEGSELAHHKVMIAALVERYSKGASESETLDWAKHVYGRLGVQFAIFERGLEKTEYGVPSILRGEELDWIRSTGKKQGGSLDLTSPNNFSWAPMGSTGAILVAVTPGDAIGGETKAAWTVFGIILLAVVISLAFSLLVSKDLSHSIRRLFESVRQIASGDLRRTRVFECENELGELSRHVDKMRMYLQETVHGILQVFDQTQAVANTVAVSTGNIASASLEQVAEIQTVRNSVEGLTERIEVISSSARNLSGDVENSSSAALQLKAVAGTLNHSASDLSHRAEEASVSIDEMAANITQVAGNTETLSRFIEEVASSVTEMASQVKEVETSAEETARLSQHVTVAAEVGRDRVQESISGTESIHEATTIAEEAVRKLMERYGAIGSIVNVIDEIADETNLLALNAAIIAAQAGESGRAFAVVADEIKDLADRVTSNTKEISELIKGLQEESDHAAELIAKSSESVDRGVDLTSEAGAALDQITHAANESGVHIREIVEGFKEHAQTSNQLVGLIESVRMGVQEIRAAGREQREGSRAVARNATEVDGIAKQVYTTADEQDRGSLQIAKSMERIQEEVNGINCVLQEQSERCGESMRMLLEMQQHAQLSENSAKETDEVMQKLLEKFQDLRNSLQQRFQIE